MSALQIRSFAEDSYPVEIRDFLDAKGYQALYQRDLDRALAAGIGDASSPTIRGVAVPVKPRRRGRRTNWPGIALRVVILATALFVSWLILTTVLLKLQGEPERSNRPSANVLTAPPVRASPASPCLQSMRDGAATWCESALTGRAVRDSAAEPELAGCGDRLRVNSDTVRLALDRILEEEVTYTYRHDEVRERCAAAAKLAAP